MASGYPLEENFIAIGAVKIGKNRYETQIYAGPVSHVLLNLNGFLKECFIEGSESRTLPISKKGFYDYVNHFINGYKEELRKLESEKKRKGIEHVSNSILSMMRKRPELEGLAKRLPSGDEHRKKLLKKIYVLDERISSLSEGMDENQLQNLSLHSSPCDIDLSFLGGMKVLPYLSESDTRTIDSFRSIKGHSKN